MLFGYAVAGIVYLDVYEGRLLETQERGMVQQARVAAVALGATGALDDTQAIAFLRALGDHGEARIKIFGADGRLMADSARFGPTAPPRPSQQYSEMADPRRRCSTEWEPYSCVSGLANGCATTMVRKCEDAADLQRGCGCRSG